jgi:hypothetical protein
MANQLMVMEGGASTNGDLDPVVEQLEMLAQKIRKKNGFKSCRRRMNESLSNWRKHKSKWQTK